MALNPDILSDIKYSKSISSSVKEFLLWAVVFEEHNLELDSPRFKKEYGAKLDELIHGAIDEGTAKA